MITNIIILIFVGVAILVMVSLIPIYFVVMLKAGKKEAVLRREGVTTDGEVVHWEWQKPPRAIFWRRASSSPFAGFITYRYYADTPGQARQLFTKKENVWVTMNQKRPIGSPIRIRYLPGNPAICQIAESILGLPHDQK
jgi:hypothetical protein